MFAIKGRLKVAVVVVGVLAVVSLGMYEAFRPQQAEANCSTTGRVHDYYDWDTGSTETTLSSWTETKNCSRCSGYPASTHTVKEVEHASTGVDIWKHRWFWSSNWNHCHSHRYSVSYVSNYTVHCNQSGSNNNASC